MKTMIEMHHAIYKIMIGNSQISNGVNNVQINNGITTSLTKLLNDRVTQLLYNSI